MTHNYSFKAYDKENMARTIGRSMPISFKHSIEICNVIRGKNVNYAKEVLSNVIKEKHAIPFKRFNHHVGHKRNIAAGRYPKKASKEILSLINSVEANAQFKGLSTSNLIIKHISADKASTTMRFGRKRSRRAKRTNVEVVLQEKAAKKTSIKKENKKEKSKEVKIQEVKKNIESEEIKPANKKEKEENKTTKEEK
ncbi:MAG: 50S ribosomal protein L22 [Bacteroidetes bacterium]|nr:50S ribosomal protein L22 [Bacteroidota bacterium]